MDFNYMWNGPVGVSALDSCNIEIITASANLPYRCYSPSEPPEYHG